MNIREQTEDALLKMGFNPANKGFGYICDAIELFEDKSLRFKTISLYKKIAVINDTNASKVERAMRHSFETVVTKGNLRMIERYLSVMNTCNSALLNTLYIRLNQERNQLSNEGRNQIEATTKVHQE